MERYLDPKNDLTFKKIFGGHPELCRSLINDCFRPDTEDFYHRYLIADVKVPAKRMEGLEFIFVELPKFKPKTMTEKKMAVLWLRFLTEIDDATRKVPDELLASPLIKEALDCVKESALTEKEMDAYDHYLDAIRTAYTIHNDIEKMKEENQEAQKEAKAAERKAEAMQKEAKTAQKEAEAVKKKAEAMQKGAEMRIWNIASKLKAMGLPAEDIAKATGLSLEEIRQC
ncbi:MAG: Rpn family recombination-promoting nuclease/putative transposase [Tannerella sp.]|jgi:FtsZ-binding cell division protein ZapB|nr:Rpn family recombination-promoting nuclease/putative transposase [Tannerella sp.]